MHATPVASVPSTLAIDLAKDVFELGFADSHGRVIQRQRLRRQAFASRLDNHPPTRILMEACGSAHFWAENERERGERGHPRFKIRAENNEENENEDTQDSCRHDNGRRSWLPSQRSQDLLGEYARRICGQVQERRPSRLILER